MAKVAGGISNLNVLTTTMLGWQALSLVSNLNYMHYKAMRDMLISGLTWEMISLQPGFINDLLVKIIMLKI